jgi:hypothetical protein
MAPLNIDADLFASTLDNLAEVVRSALRSRDPETVPLLERDEAVLDPHEHCCDSVQPRSPSMRSAYHTGDVVWVHASHPSP